MRRLKIDNYINKTGDTAHDYLIKLYGAGPVTLNSDIDYKIKIGNDIGYLKTISGELNEDNNGLILAAKDLADFPDGSYYVEVWFEENGLNHIYPSNGKARIKLDANIESVKGKLIPTITIEELRKEIAHSNTTAVKGPKGDKGDIGPQGPAGKDGAPGPKGDKGIQGAPGKDGLSAYQIWLNNGNQGTEKDFINSLKGPKGDPGEKGTDGTGGNIDLSKIKFNIPSYKYNTTTGVSREQKERNVVITSTDDGKYILNFEGTNKNVLKDIYLLQSRLSTAPSTINQLKNQQDKNISDITTNTQAIEELKKEIEELKQQLDNLNKSE